MSKNMVDIDAQKLQKALKQRHLTMSGVSEACGKSPSYVKNACANGRISKTVVMVMETQFAIKEDDIRKEQEIQEVQEVKETGMDYDRLAEVIYKAVKQAVKDGFGEI